MARLFRPLEPFKGWRKLAVHTWSPPRDPSTYALVDVPMGAAIAYCDRLRTESGVHVTVTHLTVKGVALALARFPQMNGIVSRGRIMLRESVDIFMQVATGGGAELSGLKIANADRKSVLEIAREAEERVARIRARRDQQVERTKSVLDRVPARILGRMMRIIAYLIYDLDLDLSRFGVVKDEFGTAMVSNVGVFGIRAALRSSGAVQPHADGHPHGRRGGSGGRGGRPAGREADDDPGRHPGPSLHGRLPRRRNGEHDPGVPRESGAGGRRGAPRIRAGGRYVRAMKLSCRAAPRPSRR